MGGLMPRMALHEGLDRNDRERQDQAFGLGWIEGPLERCLCVAPVPDLLTGGGVEEQGVNGSPRRDQGLDGALGDRREQLDRPLRAVLGEVDRGRGDPHLGWVAVLLGDGV